MNQPSVLDYSGGPTVITSVLGGQKEIPLQKRNPIEMKCGNTTGIKKKYSAIYNNIAGPWACRGEWDKSGTERQKPYDLTSMWSLQNKIPSSRVRGWIGGCRRQGFLGGRTVCRKSKAADL